MSHKDASFTVLFNGEGVVEMFAHAGLPLTHAPKPGQTHVDLSEVEATLKNGTTYKDCLDTIAEVFRAHPEKRFAGIFKAGKFFDLMVR